MSSILSALFIIGLAIQGFFLGNSTGTHSIVAKKQTAPVVSLTPTIDPDLQAMEYSYTYLRTTSCTKWLDSRKDLLRIQLQRFNRQQRKEL